ncbi:MAG: DUF819 family protein [Victivallaceae bacterium]|nr:DUF819 family protein [Victivallaceae bacterium]
MLDTIMTTAGGWFPIRDGYTYLALLFFVAGILKFCEAKCSGKYAKLFFNYVPAVVCLYIVTMIMGSMNLWENTAEIRKVASGSSGVTAFLLPAMIFLLLLKGDLREIVKLGPRMIAVFVIAAMTMAVGFVAAYLIFRSGLDGDSWKALSALCGSWVGGTVNMVAIQRALAVPEADMGYVLAIDTISYSVWLLLMLLAVPLAKGFDRWTGADGAKLEQVVKKLEAAGRTESAKSLQFADLIFVIGLAAAVGAVCFMLSDLTVALVAPLADSAPILSSLKQSAVWQVVYATLIGMLCGMSRIGKLSGTSEVGNTLLFFFIAVIGSKVNLREIDMGTMAVYVMLGFVVLAIHFLLLVLAAKLFKFDAYSCQTASLANIGGVASATVISSVYSPALVPIGVLMATLGTILGTGVGLLVAKILEMFQ